MTKRKEIRASYNMFVSTDIDAADVSSMIKNAMYGTGCIKILVMTRFEEVAQNEHDKEIEVSYSMLIPADIDIVKASSMIKNAVYGTGIVKSLREDCFNEVA